VDQAAHLCASIHVEICWLLSAQGSSGASLAITSDLNAW